MPDTTHTDGATANHGGPALASEGAPKRTDAPVERTEFLATHAPYSLVVHDELTLTPEGAHLSSSDAQAAREGAESAGLTLREENA